MNSENTGKGKVLPLRKMKQCPECSRLSSQEDFPFCSDRCRNLDLSRWLTGAYAIPVVDDDTSSEGDPRVASRDSEY